MKKLLVLMLVLSIASLASAGLVITVDGAPAEDSAITLMTSDTIMVGIAVVGTDTPMNMFNSYLAIAPGAPAEWTGAQVMHYGPPSGTTGPVMIPSSYAYNSGPVYSPAYGSVWVTYNSNFQLTSNGTGIHAEFEMHCTGEGDVLITLYDLAGGPGDSIVIHQIPEPITMGLLGVGALFLRRRK